jgi:hypothetical protein
MELNFSEVDANKRRVTFEYEGESDDDVEDVGTFDNDTDFTPAPQEENVKYANPNVGRFQTINRQRPVAPTRINAPIDASVVAQRPPPQPIKKKQISYDDILGSMSMRVGPDGKLQMQRQKLVEANSQNQQQQQQQRYLPTRYPQQQQQQEQRFLPARYPEQQQQEQEEQQQLPRQPLTRQQYQRLVALDMIRRQQEYQRLSQIKSTKLMFSNPSVRISTAPNNGANLNRLFRLHK